MPAHYQTRYREKTSIETKSATGKKHIAVVGGGMSAEREVSLSSSNGVCSTLVELGYQVTFVDMGGDIAVILDSLKPDIVFNCLHGTYGEDGCLQGMLNIMHIPYTHAGVKSSAISFDKATSREIFITHGLKYAQSKLVHKEDKLTSDPMPRPYVIKPISQGSSVGVELVFEEDAFDFAHYNFEYGETILVEQYIKGREIQVATLNGKALGVLEIKLLKNRFYDYETKYTEGFAEHLVPAPLSDEQMRRVLALSEKVNNLLNITGLARVEWLYQEEEDEFYILEANTHPGMTPLSICPEIAAYAGIDFPQLLEEIIATAKYE